MERPSKAGHSPLTKLVLRDTTPTEEVAVVPRNGDSVSMLDTKSFADWSETSIRLKAEIVKEAESDARRTLKHRRNKQKWH